MKTGTSRGEGGGGRGAEVGRGGGRGAEVGRGGGRGPKGVVRVA